MSEEGTEAGGDLSPAPSTVPPHKEGEGEARKTPAVDGDTLSSPAPTSSGYTGLQTLRERVDGLVRRLDAPPRESERAPLRDEIVSLAREIDSMLDGLRELRESLKPLADRYKQLYPRPPTPAPHLVDHLGASTYRERGWSALAAGAYEEAVRQLRSAIDRDPGEPSAQAMLAWAYLHLGRDVDAAKVLERALGKNPAHALTRMVAGFAELRGGRAEQATGMLRTVAYDAAGVDRTARMYAHLYLGVALGRSGQGDEGRAEILRALELGPNLTEAYWELGRLHEVDGDRHAAMEVWRRGAENRFSGWGERCLAEVEQTAAGTAGIGEPDSAAGGEGEPSVA